MLYLFSLQRARVVCITAGDWHNAAICHDGALYLWGRGDCGQLGHSDDKSRWVPQLLAGFSVVHPDRTLRRNRKPVLKALLLPADDTRRASRGAGRPAAPPQATEAA